MESIQKRLYQIKQSRLTPIEKLIYPLFFDLKCHKYSYIYVYVGKNKNIKFRYEIKNSLLWCITFNNLWYKIIKDHNINMQELRDTVSKIVKERLNLEPDRIYFNS